MGGGGRHGAHQQEHPRAARPRGRRHVQRDAARVGARLPDRAPLQGKLSAYRDELLEMLDGWQDDSLPMSVPLRRVEQLIDEGVLQPDVLMVLPDDDRYDYHYDHVD